METNMKNVEKLIKERFTEYLHSDKVINRAIKSCPIVQINEYLKKKLEQEPKWENKLNIVKSILINSDLPKCHFCGKQLNFSTITDGIVYCSKQCEQMDKKIKEKEQNVTTTLTTLTFFDKLKKLFRLK